MRELTVQETEMIGGGCPPCIATVIAGIKKGSLWLIRTVGKNYVQGGAAAGGAYSVKAVYDRISDTDQKDP